MFIFFQLKSITNRLGRTSFPRLALELYSELIVAVADVDVAVIVKQKIEMNVVALSTAKIKTLAHAINNYPNIFYHHSTQFVVIPADVNAQHRDVEISTDFVGPVPYINIQYPTDEEVKTYPIIHLTSEEGWNMDLLPKQYGVNSNNVNDEYPFDIYLMQSNLVNNLRDTIMISLTSHNSKL